MKIAGFENLLFWNVLKIKTVKMYNLLETQSFA